MKAQNSAAMTEKKRRKILPFRCQDTKRNSCFSVLLLGRLKNSYIRFLWKLLRYWAMLKTLIASKVGNIIY